MGLRRMSNEMDTNYVKPMAMALLPRKENEGYTFSRLLIWGGLQQLTARSGHWRVLTWGELHYASFGELELTSSVKATCLFWSSKSGLAARAGVGYIDSRARQARSKGWSWHSLCLL